MPAFPSVCPGPLRVPSPVRGAKVGETSASRRRSLPGGSGPSNAESEEGRYSARRAFEPPSLAIISTSILPQWAPTPLQNFRRSSRFATWAPPCAQAVMRDRASATVLRLPAIREAATARRRDTSSSSTSRATYRRHTLRMRLPLSYPSGPIPGRQTSGSSTAPWPSVYPTTPSNLRLNA